MTDNQLIAILVTLLNAGFTDTAFEGTPVVQAFQPTQQGVNTESTVFLHKRKDYWYGWQNVSKTYDSLNEIFLVAQRQRVETTFAFRALVIQDPENTGLPTASDLINEVGSIMRGQDTIQYLAALDLGLLRSIEAANEYDLDDRDQFEAAPTFITTIVHSRTRIIKVPVVESTESVFARV